MGTRSLIAIEHTDGKIASITCHWDGQPKHVGKLLHDHYTQRETVEQLINLGNISSLRKNIEPADGQPHSFNVPHVVFLSRIIGWIVQLILTANWKHMTENYKP